MDLIGVRDGELFVAVSAGDGFAPVELSEVQIDTNDFANPSFLLMWMVTAFKISSESPRIEISPYLAMAQDVLPA